MEWMYRAFVLDPADIVCGGDFESFGMPYLFKVGVFKAAIL